MPQATQIADLITQAIVITSNFIAQQIADSGVDPQELVVELKARNVQYIAESKAFSDQLEALANKPQA